MEDLSSEFRVSVAIAKSLDTHNTLLNKQNEILMEQNKLLTQMLGQMKIRWV